MKQEKVYIIAELGTSHQGDLDKAQELVSAAAKAGADAVKFQWVIADEILHSRVGNVSLPSGNISLYDTFKMLERPKEFYLELKKIVKNTFNLDFMCTPFGLESAKGLIDIGIESFKIASPELNHYPLIKECAKHQLPIYISLGVSRLSDIEMALKYVDRSKTTLLHCVTAYPAQPEEYNLLQIPHLKDMFGLQTGISDHSLDPVLVPALAVMQGAVVIEKHMCLNKNDGGLDDLIALEPKDFTRMVDTIRMTEILPESVFAELMFYYGMNKIEAILGNGAKFLAPSEESNYGRTNRSICARYDLAPGTILTEENTALFRVEKELNPGLHPMHYEVVLGRVLRQHVRAGSGINWEHF